MNIGKIARNFILSQFKLNNAMRLTLILILNIRLFSPMAQAQSYAVDDFLAGSYVAPNGLNLPYRLFVPKNYNATR